MTPGTRTRAYLYTQCSWQRRAWLRSRLPFSVLYRRGVISRWQRDDAYDHFIADLEERFAIVTVPLQDFYLAAELAQRHPLKTYDAVQLAVALRHSRALAVHKLTLIFVSGDNTLLAAAQAEGLATDNPFDHVSPQDTPQAPAP